MSPPSSKTDAHSSSLSHLYQILWYELLTDFLFITYFTIRHMRKQVKKCQKVKGSYSASLAPLHVNK